MLEDIRQISFGINFTAEETINRPSQRNLQLPSLSDFLSNSKLMQTQSRINLPSLRQKVTRMAAAAEKMRDELQKLKNQTKYQQAYFENTISQLRKKIDRAQELRQHQVKELKWQNNKLNIEKAQLMSQIQDHLKASYTAQQNYARSVNKNIIYQKMLLQESLAKEKCLEELISIKKQMLKENTSHNLRSMHNIQNQSAQKIQRERLAQQNKLSLKFKQQFSEDSTICFSPNSERPMIDNKRCSLTYSLLPEELELFISQRKNLGVLRNSTSDDCFVQSKCSNFQQHRKTETNLQSPPNISGQVVSIRDRINEIRKQFSESSIQLDSSRKFI